MKKADFGNIGMALSCTLFLEWALVRYKQYATSVDEDTIKIVSEWNKILLAGLKDSKYKPVLGKTGNKLMQKTLENQDFGNKCIVGARDVSVQSLHYVLRFDETVRFLQNKYKNNPNLTFCDFGTGLSPLAVVFFNRKNLHNVYCTDIVPEIADIYSDASYKLSGKIPNFISWQTLQMLADQGAINTVVSVGCLPHMSVKTQKEYLKIMNEKFDNFFLEIKYKTQENIETNENAFSLSDLQKLRLSVENVTDIETVVIRNAFNYLYKFKHAKPDRTDFIADCRSLFLSR